MPRRARLAVVGIAWHIIQRGNNRSACFYTEEDYLCYFDQLQQQSEQFGCAMHAYCLIKASEERFKPTHYYPEYSIQYTSADGQVISGWIDLLVETQDGLILIDHKASPPRQIRLGGDCAGAFRAVGGLCGRRKPRSVQTHCRTMDSLRRDWRADSGAD